MFYLIAAYIGGVLTVLAPGTRPLLSVVFSASKGPGGVPALLFAFCIGLGGAVVLSAPVLGWLENLTNHNNAATLIALAIVAVALFSSKVATAVSRPIIKLGTGTVAGQRKGRRTSVSLVLAGLTWGSFGSVTVAILVFGAAMTGEQIDSTPAFNASASGVLTAIICSLLCGEQRFYCFKASVIHSKWLRLGVGFASSIGALGSVLILSGYQRMGGLPVGSMPSSSIFATSASAATGGSLPVLGVSPPLDGAVEWINSPPLTSGDLRGKVVLVDFWTYSCINCIRNIPHIRAWAEKYKEQGLVVIGVHAPEFAFEKNIESVKRATREFAIHYPVAVDNDFAIWRAFRNSYWPALYLIDAKGRMRYQHFGEGQYETSEQAIEDLLAETGKMRAARQPSRSQLARETDG
ncbi:thioredoxin family protein [Ensifer adhaerens]|uniref:thioredoxin family protein n=1 Tax=Ensifer adhaerens TaxID=106592 RepID=UPI00384DE1CC